MPSSAVVPLGAWTVDPGAVAVVSGAAIAYVTAARRRRQAKRPWPARRTAAFLGGLGVVVVGTCSAVAVYDTVSFGAHAAQHALLGMVAPLLLVLGAPVTLALQTARPATRATLREILRSPPAALVSHPLAAWSLFGGTLVAGYFTPLLEWSLRHDAVHAAMHSVYLATGYVFFWSLLGVDPGRWRAPYPARMLLALLAVPFHAFAGAAMLTSRSLLAPEWYDLPGQRMAGGIVWVTGGLLGVVSAGIILWQWFRHELGKDRRREEIALATGAADGRAVAGG